MVLHAQVLYDQLIHARTCSLSWIDECVQVHPWICSKIPRDQSRWCRVRQKHPRHRYDFASTTILLIHISDR